MRSPGSHRLTSWCMTRSSTSAYWRWRAPRPGSNSPASVVASRRPRKRTSRSVSSRWRAPASGSCGSRADPCVFGRGGEEAIGLAAAGIPFRIIPGVTAGLGALASASIPATLRGINRAIIFAAGHGAEDDAFDWAPLARTGQPIVLYMVMHNLEKITQALMRGGITGGTPAAVITSATMPEERILVSTIDRVAAEALAQ